jgi:uncharacterized protein (DUF488 family)
MVGMQTTLYTIGHGNRTAAELISLLKEAGIQLLVDVRAHPASRRHPQFARAALAAALAQAGIGYVWEGKDLGGFRKPLPASPHVALAVDGFRGYADHLQTAAFEAAMARLVVLGAERRLAIMCAEKSPAECHRSFISDWLVAHGMVVVHLIAAGHVQPHQLNALARVVNGCLIYDRLAQDALF